MTADRPATEPHLFICDCCGEQHWLPEAAQGAAPRYTCESEKMLGHCLPHESIHDGTARAVVMGDLEALSEGAAPHPRTYSLVGGGPDMFLVTDDESGFNIGYARKVGGPITAPAQGAAPRMPYSDVGNHPRHRVWRCRFDGPHEGRCEPMLLIGYPDPKGAAPRTEGLDFDARDPESEEPR